MDNQGEWFKRKGTVLSLRDAVAISTVVNWAVKGAKLRWVNDGIHEGTARSIGDENGNFLSADDDVRDAHFRITTSMGWEWFVPMVDVVKMVRNSEMVEG